MSSSETEIEVRATLGRIFWESNGRIIAKLESRDFAQLTVFADMHEPNVGAEYVFTGRLEPNHDFGGQKLLATAYRTIMPETRSGIVTYLCDHARWVGPKIATQIVSEFGDEAIDVLKRSPELVAEKIRGIQIDRAREISESLKMNEAYEAAQIEMNQILSGSVQPFVARSAIKRWGSNAPHIVRRDPFALTVLRGVAFARADYVWRKLGKRLNRFRRHGHAIVEAVRSQVRKTGSTRLAKASVFAEAATMLGMPLRNRADEFAERMGVIFNNEHVSDHAMVQSERDISSMLIGRIEDGIVREELFPEIREDGLAPDQVAAVRKMQRSPVCLLLGAPGTGKTFTLARIVASLTNFRVALAAPTGKAAKQMTSALRSTVGGTAITIHSLLDPVVTDDGEFVFERDEHNPIDCDVLVLDEVSMIDTSLAASIIRAVPIGARIIMVGDHYQLPSVGPGAVLRDMITAGIPHAELTEIKRNTGLIVKACHKIKAGKLPEPASPGEFVEGDKNWIHISAANDEISYVIEQLYGRVLKDRFDCDLFNDVQCISPVNEKGQTSCDALNRMIRPHVSPGAYQVGKLDVFVGDRIVQLRNAGVNGWSIPPVDFANCAEPDIDVKIVNGDIGVLKAVDKKYLYITFSNPNRSVRISRENGNLKPAYCLTCHKMQGSEAPIVIVPLSKDFASMPMMTREWVYTAFSRAKQCLITVGSIDVLRVAVGRQSISSRCTGLGAMIADRIPSAIEATV